MSQWHVVRLKNPGGGPSEPWTLSGAEDAVHFNLNSGNLRGEQEIYFQISTNHLQAGVHRQTIRFAGAGGTLGQLDLQFSVH